MDTGRAATLAQALVAAQADMPAVEPDATNPHFKSRFVSLDHLIAKTRPVLNKHGLAITQAPTHIDGQPALATTIYHESGESATDTMPLILAGSDMQKLGAALTYARRYAWAAALGICADEDDDGNAVSKPASAAGAGTEATAGEEAPVAAAPSDPVGEAALLVLVTEGGGDVDAVKASIESARKDPEKFGAWLKFQKDWWTAHVAEHQKGVV